jgi:intermediate cleaving peptidase 55
MSTVSSELENTSSGCNTILFCRGKDPARELWEGSRTSFNTAASVFSVDDVQPIEKLPETLESLASHYDHIYTDGAGKRRSQKSILKFLSSPTAARSELEGVIDTLPGSKRRSLVAEVGKLRVVKSEAEQRAMRQAAEISGCAHAKVSLNFCSASNSTA